MLMVGTKHRADRISIRGLLTVREGERGSQRALIPPASLSILEGGGVSVGVGVGRGGGLDFHAVGMGALTSSISASA